MSNICCGYWHSRLAFSVLSCISIVRNDCSDSVGRGFSESWNCEEQFHKIIVHRLACWLDNEYIFSSHAIKNLDVCFSISKFSHRRSCKRNTKLSGNLFCEFFVWIPTKHDEVSMVRFNSQFLLLFLFDCFHVEFNLHLEVIHIGRSWDSKERSAHEHSWWSELIAKLTKESVSSKHY